MSGQEVVRYGVLRQRNTAAFLFRAMVRPIPEKAEVPIKRLYYFNLVDLPGDYYRRADAYGGRCELLDRGTADEKARCVPSESGLLGSAADTPDEAKLDRVTGDFNIECKSRSTAPNARRPVFKVINQEGRFTRPIKEPKRC